MSVPQVGAWVCALRVRMRTCECVWHARVHGTWAGGLARVALAGCMPCACIRGVSEYGYGRRVLATEPFVGCRAAPSAQEEN